MRRESKISRLQALPDNLNLTHTMQAQNSDWLSFRKLSAPCVHVFTSLSCLLSTLKTTSNRFKFWWQKQWVFWTHVILMNMNVSMCLPITQSLQRLIIFSEMLNTNSTMRGKHEEVELIITLKYKFIYNWNKSEQWHVLCNFKYFLAKFWQVYWILMKNCSKQRNWNYSERL